MNGARRPALRRLAVWLGHAPALWLLYREPLPRRLRGKNLIAAAATLVLMVGVGLATGKLAWVGLAWLAGHVAWGTYLACRLEP